MNTEFSRIDSLPKYVFNITNELKEEAIKNGKDIIDFSMGNPDNPTPKHIVEKLIQSSQKNYTHRYSISKGIPELRKAITNWYKKRYLVDLDYKTEAIATLGSKEGIASLAKAITSPKDLILSPSPAYPIHPYGFTLAGAKIINFPCGPGYDCFSEIENAIKKAKSKPKILILNYPSNPTTKCVDLEFFAKIIKLCKHHKIWVMQDLAYADIVYDGYKAPSILQIKGAKDIAVEFFSLSKSYNMPGWRVGFMVGNQTLVKALAKIKSYLDYGIFIPIQMAAIEALEGEQKCVLEIKNIYENRRNVLCEGLNEIGWKVEKPKATMFVWAKIPKYYSHMGSLEFCKKLIKNASVATSPGIGFGDLGDKYIRMSLIENEQRTRQALENLAQMFKLDKFYA